MVDPKVIKLGKLFNKIGITFTEIGKIGIGRQRCNNVQNSQREIAAIFLITFLYCFGLHYF